MNQERSDLMNLIVLPTKSDQKELINGLITKAGIRSITDLVNAINKEFPEHETSIQNFNQKAKRGSFKGYELAQIAQVCGFHLVFQAQDEIISGMDLFNTVYSKFNGVLVFTGRESEAAYTKFKEESAKAESITQPFEVALIYHIQSTYDVTVSSFSF